MARRKTIGALDCLRSLEDEVTDKSFEMGSLRIERFGGSGECFGTPQIGLHYVIEVGKRFGQGLNTEGLFFGSMGDGFHQFS